MLSESSERRQGTSNEHSTYSVPLPLALAGIGMILAYALPGGVSGGTGFLIGLGSGFGILFVAFLDYVIRSRPAHVTVSCPNCGKLLRVDCRDVGTTAHTASLIDEPRNG